MSVAARMMAQIGKISAKKMPFSMTTMFSIQSYDCDWALMSDPRIRSGAKVRKIRPITTRSGQPSRTSAPSAGNRHSTTTGNTPAMRMFFAALGAVLWASVAAAQPSGTVAVAPALSGCGSLAVTNSSAPISGLTKGTGCTNNWLMPLNGQLAILNAKSSAGNVYVCFFGGACTVSTGFPVVPGQQVFNVNLGGSTTSPTVIADTTATIWITW